MLYELSCNDGDYYTITEEVKTKIEQYLEDNNVTMRDIGIGIYPIHVFDHMPSCIVGYVEDLKTNY